MQEDPFTIQRVCSPRSGGGAVRVRSAALVDRDVQPDRHPRRTRPARSLVDAAIRAPIPAAARVLLMRGVQAGIVTPDHLADVLNTRGQCRYPGLLREAVIDLDGGVRSVPEREFSELIERGGLPRPARQARVQAGDGHFYLDAYWLDLLRAALYRHAA